MIHLRADVADRGHQAARDLPLNLEAPLLDRDIFQVRAGGEAPIALRLQTGLETIGDVKARSRTADLHRAGVHERLPKYPGWVKTDRLLFVVGHTGVKDSSAGADHGTLTSKMPPRKAEARGKILLLLSASAVLVDVQPLRPK